MESGSTMYSTYGVWCMEEWRRVKEISSIACTHIRSMCTRDRVSESERENDGGNGKCSHLKGRLALD